MPIIQKANRRCKSFWIEKSESIPKRKKVWKNRLPPPRKSSLIFSPATTPAHTMQNKTILRKVDNKSCCRVPYWDWCRKYYNTTSKTAPAKSAPINIPSNTSRELTRWYCAAVIGINRQFFFWTKSIPNPYRRNPKLKIIL